jgi:nitrate/TMAO reductase-like tetraheme cytochrome c subunit
MKSFIFIVTMPALFFLIPFPVLSMGQEATDAKALFEKKCSVCHSADRAKSAKKTNEEWANTVTRMKNKTGNISVEEVKIIIDYLTKTYGK